MTRGVYGTSLSAADSQPVVDAAANDQMIDKSFAAQELIDPGVSARSNGQPDVTDAQSRHQRSNLLLGARHAGRGIDALHASGYSAAG